MREEVDDDDPYMQQQSFEQAENVLNTMQNKQRQVTRVMMPNFLTKTEMRNPIKFQQQTHLNFNIKRENDLTAAINKVNNH